MNLILRCGLAGVLSFASLFGFAAPSGHVPGQILVAPRAGLPAAEFKRLLKEHGGVGKKLDAINVYVVDLPAGREEHAIASLGRNPHIKFAELNTIARPTFAANDYYFPSEWYVPKIHADSAWDISQGAGIVVADLDTGLYVAHEDLVGQTVPGWNLYDNNADTTDVHNHGTWTAGVIVALTNNTLGVSSIAPMAKVMPLRICDLGGWASGDTMAKAIIYAADHGARVANLSYSNVPGNATVQSAGQYLKSKGGLLVVAADNTGTNPGWATTTSMIPVSATDQNDALTSFSSYGDYVVMSAPGTYIYTTSRSGGYSAVLGTSFASPIIAGTVANMMAANPKLSNLEIENLLYSTAVDLGAPGRDIYFGYGRVDVAAAVQAAQAAVSQVDTTPPVISISSPTNSDSVLGLVPVNVQATDNMGVTKVELRVGGTLVATDTTWPYAFTWDSSKVVNGAYALVATAYDAAGNSAVSSPVVVNVINPPDTTSPVVQITSPSAGSIRGKGNVTINSTASDNAGTVTQTLLIDGGVKATGAGSLSYSWNVTKVSSGVHTIQVVAKDAAGNTSSAQIQVTKP